MFNPAKRWATVPSVWLIGGISLLLLAYTATRAAVVSFSYDEAYTALNHVRKGLFYQDRFDLMGANHHLLNVWLMWLSMKLFGVGEFALRLPNLLAHVLYLYGSARIALRASSALLAVTAFLLLNLHPYLLDFFSLARGYGLSCGFMMMALWCTWSSLEHRATRGWALCAIVFAALGAMAHSIVLNFLLGLVGAYFVLWVLEAREKGIKTILPAFAWATLIVLACFALVLPNAMGLYKGGSLYFGSDGLWNGMMDSLAVKFLYHYPYTWTALYIIGWLLAAMACWFLISLVAAWKGFGQAAPLLFGLLILATIVLSLWVQSTLLDLPWPRSRTALFLVPLLAFLLVASLLSWSKARWLPIAASLLFCVPLVSHMGKSWNLTHVVEWKLSGELRRMLEIIAQDHLPFIPQRPVVTVSAGEECSGSLGYYMWSRGWPWLVNAPRSAPALFPQSDYYIVEFDGQNVVDRAQWSLLYHSEETNTSLFRDERARKVQPDLVHHGVQDMEAPNVPGACKDDHVSGLQCVRFDEVTNSTERLQWTVPPDWDGSSVLATGSLLSREQDDTNWLSMVVQLVRDGQVIEQRDIASHKQILRYHEWGRESVALRTTTRLLPGDRIEFVTSPLVASPPILLDDMELWITR